MSIRRITGLYRYCSGAQARAGLAAWYRSAAGASLYQEEQVQLDEALGNLFGYHLLQAGAPQGRDLAGISRIAHRIILVDPEVDQALSAGASRCAGVAEQLPLATDSIDVLLLPHTLGLSEDPHQVLRETDRVLIADGHVVILGFNPWSLWGLVRLFSGWRQRVPWCCRFLGARRVREWLSLLGFDTVLLRHFHYRPPLRHDGLLRHLRFLEPWGRRWWPGLGAVYLLVARKRVIPLTPIRQHRPIRRSLVGVRLVGSPARKQLHEKQP